MTLPPLPLEEWEATKDTLQLYLQILGKVRLKLSPRVNHWWHVPYYLTARGITTSPIPFAGGTFEGTFDFIDHVLEITTSNGERVTIALGRPVAEFYHQVREAL